MAWTKRSFSDETQTEGTRVWFFKNEWLFSVLEKYNYGFAEHDNAPEDRDFTTSNWTKRSI